MRVAFALTLLFVTSCADFMGDKERTMGDPIGHYQLSANADMQSTCTEIINSTPRPWSFEVSLRKDANKAYWLSGDDPIEGTIDSRGGLAFKRTLRVPVRPADKARELGPCTILRTDDFVGSLAGAPTTETGRASFTGTLRYSYQIEAGSDCRDVVGNPGPERKAPLFAVLPCDARFAVDATRVGDAKAE
jgi:hypothetical protein